MLPFRVLLSYARDDAGVAGWLQRRANSYRTPRALVGTRGAFGPVPARIKLGPASRAYSVEGVNGFEEAQALIVVCSPSAAADEQVNRDVDAFVSLGRARRTIPIIGPQAPEAEDVERDYFPPALSGRGLFTVDLRERRVGDVLLGDGREGGWVKLVAELLGVDVARLAQQEGRQQSVRATGLTLVAGACAAAAVVAAGYGLRSDLRADSIETQRQHAVRNAMRELQLRREALATAEQTAAEQASAGQEFERAKGTVLGAVRDIGSLTDTILGDIGESRTISPATARALGALERTYWDIGDASPYFEIRPVIVTGALERISATYVQIGHPEEAARLDSRLARLNARVAGNRTAAPAWRSAYAAAIISIADHRGANGDDAGRSAAMQQGARIYEDVCLAPPRVQGSAIAETRARACLRYAGLALTRAGQQRLAEQSIDTASLRRARTVLEAAIAAFPNNSDVQSRAPRMRDQIDHIVEEANTVSASAAQHATD